MIFRQCFMVATHKYFSIERFIHIVDPLIGICDLVEKSDPEPVYMRNRGYCSTAVAEFKEAVENHAGAVQSGAIVSTKGCEIARPEFSTRIQS